MKEKINSKLETWRRFWCQHGTVVLLIFLTALVAGVGSYSVTRSYFLDKLAQQQVSVTASKEDSGGDGSNKEEAFFPQGKEIKTIYVSEVIKEGWIEWQEPERLENLGLTTLDTYQGAKEISGSEGYFSRGVRYFKVGEIIQGNFAGSDLLLFQSFIQEGSDFSLDFHRVIRNDRGEFIFLLGYHGGGVEREWEQSHLEQVIKRYFSQKDELTFKSYRVKIEELSYPVKLVIDSGRQELEMDSSEQAFFSGAKLKEALMHPQWGQIWITDSAEFKVDLDPEKEELNSYLTRNKKGEVQKKYVDIFGAGGLYIKAPDGTTITYKLNLEGLFDSSGVLEATWNDGLINERSYKYRPEECEDSRLFVYDWSQEVSSGDLKWIGRTRRGDSLYGFGSIESPELEEFFQRGLLAKDQFDQRGEELPTKRPVVFWVDPFGRRLAFLREEFISKTECD